MSVSHPNCISSYKLSVIRLLRGDGLLDPEDSATSLPMLPTPPASVPASASASQAGAHGGSGGGGGGAAMTSASQASLPAPTRAAGSGAGTAALSLCAPTPTRLSTDSDVTDASTGAASTFSGPFSAATSAAAWLAAAGMAPATRRVRSLLSGAEAEAVGDPYGQLAPGLYETWLVTEVGKVGWVGLGGGCSGL